MIRRRTLSVLLLLAALGLPALVHAGAEATHPHVCTAAATASTTDIDCPDWNAAHVLGGAGAAQGTLPYYDTGESTKLNWATELLYDEVTFSLGLGGGTVGTNGLRILSLGSVSGADPTTFPANSMQCRGKDTDGAGTTGLACWDELGARYTLGRTALGGGLLGLTVLTAGAAEGGLWVGDPMYLGTISNHSLQFYVNNVLALHLDRGTLNVGIGTATFGASGAGVLAIKSGTCETASVADQAGLCVRDRNGAATAEFARRNEEGHLESFGAFVHARSTNEATTTNSAVDLHTLNTAVSIPTTDGVVIRFSWRKTSGAAATASIGLKVNTVAIIANTAITAATNANENGYCEITVWNRATSYLRSLKATCWNNVGPLAYNLFASADMTVAAITDLRITGVTGSASVTLGVRDVVVQRIAGF